MRIKELVGIFEEVGIKRYSIDNRGGGIIRSEVIIRERWYRVNMYWHEIVISDEDEDIVLFTDKRNLERQLRKMVNE